jgi:spore coat polysaccharide biosynthesis protein SpsF
MKALFISARTGSTRLPNKATLDLCGRPAIQYLIDNLKKSVLADRVILCTTQLDEDDILCRLAKENGILFFRGSSEDKLERWRAACEEYDIQFFINADGDDLFFDYGLADLCFKQYIDTGADFIDGRGLYNDVYGITYDSLKKVCANKPDNDTEFIRPHFVAPAYEFTVEPVKNTPGKYLKKNIRMTLDYEEDLRFFEAVVSYFINNDLELEFQAILDYLEMRPDIVDINWAREQNWKDNQKKMIDRVNV